MNKAGIVHGVDESFDAAWIAADAVPGWLTRAQAQLLWDAAGSVAPDGVIAEIGSHQGRSTLVLGRRAQARGARVVAIDPFVAGGMFGGTATRARFEQNVSASGLDDVVRLVARPSTELRRTWREPLAMIYVDGKHDYWTTRDDLRWLQFLDDGAPLLVHDSFSSIGVTTALLVHVLPGHRLRFVERAGSLARFTVGQPSGADRLRLIAQLGWFARNVVIKGALRALRVVGYRRADPY